MLIIGCDYHPSFQQIAFVDTATGSQVDRHRHRYVPSVRRAPSLLGNWAGRRDHSAQQRAERVETQTATIAS